MPLMLPRAGGRFTPAALFQPRCVAVVGAETACGAAMLANLRGGAFAGPVLAAPAEVGALPQSPDLAVVATAPEQVGAALAALGAAGCAAAIVPEGAPDDLAALARAAGVRVLGPGSFGIAVPGLGLNATRAHVAPKPGRLALVSQSGALCRAVLDWAEPNGIGFSHIAGIGGNADIGFGLVLDWLSRDPGTGAILLDIRRLKDHRAFLSAARAASRLRPVVALRAGSRLADPTGAAEAVFDAALQRAGVLGVAGYDELIAAVATLTRARPLRHDAMAIVTNAIGPGRMAADAALRTGLSLAELSAQTRLVVQVAVPSGGGAPGAPVHVAADQPIRLAEVAALLGAAPEVGGLLVVHAPAGPQDAAAMDALAACAAALRLPLLVCAMGETTGAANRRRLAAAGLPVFVSPEQAVRGFADLVAQRRARAAARELPPSAVLPLAPDRAAVARLLEAARAAGRLSLAQDQAMAVLAAYGVPAVPGLIVDGAEAAVTAAARLGFPVVLKRRRMGDPDRDKPGGLVLDLGDAEAVRRAAAAIAARTDAAAGFLVQRQVHRARELAVRVADDAVFGPAIAFGLGGTAADIIGDFAYGLPPLNLPLAHGLIARTRAARLLGAFRDQAAVDVEPVAETLVRISQLLVDFPEIAALKVNPLFALEAGVQVGDAWIALRPAGERSRLAIPPYPAELTEEWTTGGETLTIRPIRPEDAEAHAGLFRHLSPEDVRFRFFAQLRELSAEQIARMTQVDYEREIAFIAVRNAETVGVARLVREPPDLSGEFAVLVRADMKGRGLASRLMRRLIDWGRAQGLQEITGQVLADNAPMLAFVRHLGFALHRLPEEPDVMEARLAL
jgi:acetyltransferase